MDKKETVINRIEQELLKLNNKENTVYFFIIDTKGNPSGSLEYIYKLAKIIQEAKYNVAFLYQKEENDEFVGVREWLGDKYADMPHFDISSEEISVSPSDILFIPEIFANLMQQTKKLPCKRIAILQNYDFVLEQMPFSAQWGDFGILDAITNTEINKELLKSIFPYVKTTVISPYIDKYYGETDEPKKLIVNIISKNQSDINKIIKPFYWKYPMYKWVTFRELRGFPKETYSQMLREAAITIYVDDDTNFGYGALEAMKSGSIVLAKTTTLTQNWMEKEGETLSDCCIWFDNFFELQRMLASVIYSWMQDAIPEVIKESASKSLSLFSYEKTQEEILTYINEVMAQRKNEMEEIIKKVKSEEIDEK